MGAVAAITAGLDRWFKIHERGSSISTEIRAGIVTFLTMSYILLVNPQLLSQAGLPLKEVVTSTALTSCLASLLVGCFANLPVGIAPGMGLNAYMVFSQVLGMGVSLPQALATCMAAAVLVAFLALVRALTLILHLVPNSIKLAVVVGMGLLLSFIGLQTAHVVVRDDETMVKMGDLASVEVWLAMFGLSLIASLHYRNVKGSIMIGIVATALGYYIVKNDWPTQFVSLPELRFWKLDFSALREMGPDTVAAVTAYALVMIFDIGGAMFGLCNLAGLVKDNAVPGAIATYLSAAAGTALGALTGTTPLIIAAESAVGIKEGGRTGLVAVTVSACFGASLFFAPMLQAVPAVATAPVLVLVGAMMMGESGHINWTSMPTAVPAFLTMVVQPFTFSIANGIYAGLLFSLLLFFMTGDFIPYFRSLIAPEAGERLAEAEGGLAEPLLVPGGHAEVSYGGPSAAAHADAFKRSSTAATNIVRSVSRRIAHDIATSPAFTTSTHELLIGTPPRGGPGSRYGSHEGMHSGLLSTSHGSHMEQHGGSGLHSHEGSLRGGAAYFGSHMQGAHTLSHHQGHN